MTDFQGALGVAQMNRLDWILQQRARLAQRYDEAFNDIEWLKPQSVLPGSNHSYQSYVCLFKNESHLPEKVESIHKRRDEWMNRLEANGIATRPGTHAIHLLHFYREKYGYEATDFPNSYVADRLTVTLPLYPQMTDEEQKYIIDRIKELPG
jgi:dTDP-4-amino-4,6-dideoxygalactose transaminase